MTGGSDPGPVWPRVSGLQKTIRSRQVEALATESTWARIRSGTRWGCTPYGWPVPKVSEMFDIPGLSRWQ